MPSISFKTVLVVSAALSYPLTKTSDSTYPIVFCRVFGTCLLLWVIYRGILYPNLLSPLRHLPTVDGNAWWSRQSLRLISEPKGLPQSDWVEQVPHHQRGLVRYRTALNQERLIVASPEALAEVLTTKNYHFKKPQIVANALKPIAGAGILLAEGDHHKEQRKTLLPAFAYRHIKDLYGLMWDISSHAVTSLTEAVATKSKADQQPYTIDMMQWASKVTLDIIFVGGMGQSFESVRCEDRDYMTLRRIYKTVFSQSIQDLIMFILRVWIMPYWMVQYVPLKRNVELQEAARTLRDICRQLIRQKKSDLESEVADKGEKDILTVALNYGGFTEDELVEQLLTFLAAGHETTATALTWAVYVLSKNHEMQTRLRDEIRAHLPSPSSSKLKTSEELSAVIDNNMPYLQAVCLEVLRYFAPVPITSREAAVDTSINGTPIPAGTILAICPRATNHDLSLWGDDAQIFNPDRYLSQPKRAEVDPLDESEHSNKHTGTRSNYATLTFLHGPRSCIGQSFSKAELAILLATLVGRFEFSLVDESLRDEAKIKLRNGATNRPANGMHVKVQLVEGW
ncbi:cytochrome P450 [Xylaria bambusicola]|uniref:cytochrome P450 n=1 Tax=Xylaria bambusicola TaxID=326684 RepID=UPI002007F469|nr:cytochrome P450 [Xylaria bambusicola]KAI0520985.1 cytochrome P450 [Xylaria bambusicola]